MLSCDMLYHEVSTFRGPNYIILISHATLCHVYACIHALSHELFIHTFNEVDDDDEDEDDEDVLK